MFTFTSKTRVTAKNIQQALSLASGNPVTKRSLINQATALAAGFSSYEQAMARFDRFELIESSVWIEYNYTCNRWVVCAGDLRLEINTMDTMFINLSPLVEFPNKLMGVKLSNYSIIESEIEFNAQRKEIVISTSIGIKLSFLRVSDDSLHVYIHEDFGTTLREYNGIQSNSDFIPIFHNEDVQIPRLCAECVMIADMDIKPIAQKYGLTAEDVQDVQNTALYLFEKEKGVDEGILEELKPKKLFPKAMGLLAHLYLTHHFTYASRQMDELLESMSLEYSELNLLRSMAENNAARFLFSHF